MVGGIGSGSPGSDVDEQAASAIDSRTLTAILEFLEMINAESSQTQVNRWDRDNGRVLALRPYPSWVISLPDPGDLHWKRPALST